MISVKATLAGGMDRNILLLRQFQKESPYVYRNNYFANARAMSPEVTGRLKRSIGSQILGDRLTIVWRSTYAAAVNAGGHTDKTTHFVPAKGFGYRGRGYLAKAGTFHPYRTGSKGFANRIAYKTNEDHEKYIAGKFA